MIKENIILFEDDDKIIIMYMNDSEGEEVTFEELCVVEKPAQVKVA